VVIVYDQKFNSNEWFVIAALTIGVILVWKLPKRFPIKESLVYFIGFVFLGMVFDNTIGIKPFDYYDVNDKSSYQLMDFVSHLTYGPFGYLYIYFYDFFKIKNPYSTIYIFLWTIISLVMEYIAHALGLFYYKNGYEIYYSFPIYLLLLMSYLCLYKLLNSKKAKKETPF